MKKLPLFFFLLMTECLHAQKILPLKPYPAPQRGDWTDNYFQQKISDPYQWLEDDRSQATAAWVEQENAVTLDYLKNIPQRPQVARELNEIWNFTKYSSPTKEGKYCLYYKNDGLQNQSVLYIQEGWKGTPRELINPNKLNEKGTTALGSVVLSRNQKYCAYSVSEAGSDWQEIHVKDVKSGAMLNDVIRFSKFSSISWKGDEGFYYSGYDRPDEKLKYSAKTEFQKIFYHIIGKPQAEDKLIYEDKQHPLMYKSVALSEDQRWLMLDLSQGTDGSELRYFDLKDPVQKEFKLLSPGFKYNQAVIENLDGKFLVLTNQGAPNYRLVLIDPLHTEEKAWINLIPEKEYKLESVHVVGEKIICTYLQNASSKVEIYNLKGGFESNLALPGIGTVSGFEGTRKDDHTFYTFTSFNVPPTIYTYDLKTESSEVFRESALSRDPMPTVVKQIWFTSKDGTKVPMFLYFREDIDLSRGPHPVMLYGYGGFNISLTPTFSIPMSYFVQKGGIYVSVSLRGGGEFGEKWHQMGMLKNKQNVFDDFISAAEYLIKNNITIPGKLAIHGRSNGGLLVGACMTQRPDLFKVALPGVGVLDMLRYHKFTVGWGWAVEYGSSDVKDQFDYLIRYSPLHNLKPGTSYPATMITTGDHDDRVVPAHSFKFAATLQQANRGPNPMLIRIDTQAGHGAGKPTSKQINEWIDILSFTMYHLGMK